MPLSAIIYSRSRLHFTIFFPTQNILNLSATTSRLRWQRKAGPRQGWTRCSRSTVSYGSLSVSMVPASVRSATLSRTSVTDAPFPFPVGLSRLALRPFTFSNGVTVPAGTIIAAPAIAIHTDGEFYPNPETFDGFRFAKLREHDGAPVVGQQATSTSAEYLSFGYGRHAW